MTAEIVIGLGYGDEGKGITTDYLCNRKRGNSIVIRFSGGQQAGHTVMLDDIKHIHSNFGSGTLRGVPTYFSEHTTFYPVTLMRELKILQDKGLDPELVLHPLAKMTTPWDVFANRNCEYNKSHGTCGLGVGKTMKRNEGPVKLNAIDLLDMDILRDKVQQVRKWYKAETDGDPELTKEVSDFVDAIMDMDVEIADYTHLLNYSNLIFEGSQGILLDMDFGVFPYVTYANTTSKNAMEILDFLEVQDRHVYYVTRAYSTRHGDGPFQERPLKLKNNEEEINVYNKWQKGLKVAPISYTKLDYAIQADKVYSSYYQHSLVVTCLDQVPKKTFDARMIKSHFDYVLESHSPYSKDFKVNNMNEQKSKEKLAKEYI